MSPPRSKATIYLEQARALSFLNFAFTDIVYCHVEDGCRVAASGMHANNGIARAPNGTVYVASLMGPAGVTVLEEQSDHTLVIIDSIKISMLSAPMKIHSLIKIQTTQLIICQLIRMALFGEQVCNHT